MQVKPKVTAIVGPTASGKTALSIKLASKIGGEVISADSRQVYRGLDIGTGKVTQEEMNGITHHLIDIADPADIYTGMQFKRDATKAISEITSRQHIPIIAGGTFFYVDLLREKMQAAPVEPDHSYRESLANYSNEELVELLQQRDSRRANNIDHHNRRRLVRALEIIHTLGSVPEQVSTDSPYDWLLIGITTEKEALREKFRQRLTQWLDMGLLAEVARVKAELSPERFAEMGFEYGLTAAYIDNTISTDELFDQFEQKNWQYAKQQITWLKKDPAIVWIDPNDIKVVYSTTQDFLA